MTRSLAQTKRIADSGNESVRTMARGSYCLARSPDFSDWFIHNA